MIRVYSFFCCFKLETGGIIIGSYTFITHVFAILFSLIGGVAFTINQNGSNPSRKARKYMIDDDNSIKSFFRGSEELSAALDDMSKISESAIWLIVIITLIVTYGIILISYLCIRGTESRNHKRVRPMMILMAVFSSLCFLNIFSRKIEILLTGLFFGILYGYMFVVMHSLFTMFKQESQNEDRVRYHIAELK